MKTQERSLSIDCIFHLLNKVILIQGKSTSDLRALCLYEASSYLIILKAVLEKVHSVRNLEMFFTIVQIYTNGVRFSSFESIYCVILYQMKFQHGCGNKNFVLVQGQVMIENSFIRIKIYLLPEVMTIQSKVFKF